MLQVADVSVRYGKRSAVRGVSLELADEITMLVGHNGAGKSSFVNSVMGVVPRSAGTVTVNGKAVPNESSVAAYAGGLRLVPQAAGTFPALKVEENLAIARKRAPSAPPIDPIELFPILGERRRQLAGTLSGGERQMLAVAIALESAPAFLILDEPSLGLAPRLAEQLLAAVGTVHAQTGIGVLLIDQDLPAAADISTRAVVMQTGTIVFDDTPTALLGRDDLWELF